MINSLTSLRFFFAFAVFLSHLTFVKTDLHWYNWLKNVVFFEGYLGVGFFFILSGFVLALNYQNKINKPHEFSLKNFYINRVARIYPLHLLTFALMIPYVIFQDLWNPLAALLNLFLLQAYVPIQEIYFSINNPSWSISTEFFFYILFPFLVMMLYRYKFTRYIPLAAIPVIIFSAPYVDIDFEKGIYYINPLVRSLDFLLGIILYNEYRRFSYALKNVNFTVGSLIEACAFLVLLLFFIFHQDVNRVFRYGIYYWLPMSLIIVTFSIEKGFISRILNHRWLIYLGEISFGFYMIHMVVIKYGNLWLVNVNDFVKIGIYFLVSLFLSFITFEYFEKPINRWIKKKYKQHLASKTVPS
ncbi:acyltransferase family protein [Vaginella massiliensis]|uniref:acyltransferase family protein n=1 Tax=Vaginella massiliensis TaxID=1816680 RepID=UPI003752043B